LDPSAGGEGKIASGESKAATEEPLESESYKGSGSA